MSLSKEVISGKKQGGLLGRWTHWYPRNSRVAFCGFKRNRIGSYPITCPECPTCLELMRLKDLKGNN